jgi:hypothetical protein
MPDPLEALRRPHEPADPRPEFAHDLLTRVRARVQPAGVAARPAREERTAMTTATTAPTAAYGALDDALDALTGTAPEFDPWGTGFCLTNHAPMAVEALCAMGRPDAVGSWVEWYRRMLDDAPAPREPIVAGDWRDALGDLGRVTDWTNFFHAELAEDSWVEVLNRWVARLAPGMYTAGTHGPLRVAHAVRALGDAETPLRVRELGEALGYWAAYYETLPDAVAKPAGLLPSQALERVEQLPLNDRTGWLLFIEPIAKLDGLRAFASVADLVDVERDPSEFLCDLTAAIAGLLVTNVATVSPRPIVHAFTAGSATRLMLPHLTSEVTAQSLRYGWQVAAAFYAALFLEPAANVVETPDELIDDLIDEAIACRDEHGIKITEACVREYRINPNPVYLVAARETTRRLVERGVPLP